MRHAFTNATVWTASGPEPTTVMERATLLIEDGVIVDVGSDVSTEGARIVDCSDRFLLPGLIDAHSHTGIWGEGGHDDYDGNELSEAVTPYIRTIDSIYPEDPGFSDARRGGVTTIGITHGSGNAIGGQVTVVKAAGTVADEMVIRAPAGMKMALGENPKRVGESMKRAPQSRMGVAHVARNAFYEALEYRADWEHHAAREATQEAKPPEDRTPVRPPRRDLGMEVLLQVLDGDIPVRNHAHRMDDIRTAIRLSEEFGYRLVIDHATESYRIADEIVTRGIPVAVGPVFGERAKRELNNQTPATAGIMVAKGATVAIITDSPFNPVQFLRDLVILAIREGLSEDEALATVTINPAEILGVADRVGSLEAGKDADFILLDGDPWDARSHVTATYIDGVEAFRATGPYIPV